MGTTVFKQYNVIIVGATSGLGEELAILYIKSGYKVGVAGRRVEKLAALKERYPNQVEYEAIDIVKEDAPSQLGLLIDKLGGMDIYIHSSGVGYQNPNLKHDINSQTTLTNVYGFTQMVDTAFNYFKEQKKTGQIVTISSVAGTKGIGAAATYSATKRYQYTYIDALDQLSTTHKLGIKFTDIRPGFVRTEILKQESNYPFLMTAEYASKKIFKAIQNKKRRAIINWKFKILVFVWKLIPQCIWKHINVGR